MTPDPRVIHLLRKAFLEGATPSRLIESIAGFHAGDPQWPRYVHTYFSSAFMVVVLEWENVAKGLPVDARMAAYLNGPLLHEMVGRAPMWRNSLSEVTPGTSWLDGLSVSLDESSLIAGIHPERQPSLAVAWSGLSDPVKEFIARGMVNSQAYCERVRILSRLVEELQTKISRVDSGRDSANFNGSYPKLLAATEDSQFCAADSVPR